MSPVSLVIIIGLVFSPAAALVAFLTAYTTYTRSPNPDKRLALKMALRTAFTAFAFFVILAVGIALFIGKVIRQ